MKKKTKTKTIIFVATLFAFIISIFFVSTRQSEEMRFLVGIENDLFIPKAEYRKEHDKGCYKDGKNAQQYDRRIYYSFASNTPIPEFREVLTNNSDWEVLPVDELSLYITRFVKKTGDACLSIHDDTVRGRQDSSRPYGIFLDDCLDREVCRDTLYQ